MGFGADGPLHTAKILRLSELAKDFAHMIRP